MVIYTIILKRRTAQNIVWGGAAGCFPVVIAWAAVTNTVEWPAIILFMVIFLWTPPHYWPLSMRYGEDYRNANVPMLGAIAGAKVVSVQVVLYAWAMVACSLLMVPAGGAGWVYTVDGRPCRSLVPLRVACPLQPRAARRHLGQARHEGLPRLHQLPDAALHRPGGRPVRGPAIIG